MNRLARTLGLAVALALLPHAVFAGDANANGVDDAVEEALLHRFAPVVLLAPGERARPANVDWFLARASLGADGDREPKLRVTQASLLGDVDAVVRAVHRGVARLRPHRAARPGSADPHDWVTYGHVYRAEGGGVLVQYWFFYPFNDAHWIFDHEGDWEHVTVKLDGAGRPLGAWYARHDHCAPGRWFAWDALQREGDHPVVLSARGTHASYADADDVPFYDRACTTRDPADAAAHGCAIWRTWASDTGGVVNTGPRDHPRAGATFVAWPGQWGTIGWMGRDTGGPPGPAYQAGWCSQGTTDCR